MEYILGVEQMQVHWLIPWHVEHFWAVVVLIKLLCIVGNDLLGCVALEREQRFWQLGSWFLVQAIPAQGVYKQAHHNFFSPALLKEGRRLLQPPSSSWLPSPFFKHHGALSHSTLQDDDLAFQEDQVWALTCLMFDKSSHNPIWSKKLCSLMLLFNLMGLFIGGWSPTVSHCFFLQKI